MLQAHCNRKPSKQEKLKTALENLTSASNPDLTLRAYNMDGSSKTVPVEPKQTAWEVCQVLVEQNLYKTGSDWTLVEHIDDLQIGN